VQDIFIEQFHATEKNKYLYEGDWVNAVINSFEIKVKGEENHVQEVLTTRHGPIISDLEVDGETEKNYKLALQWVGYRPTNMLANFLALNRARHWHDFRAAFSDWSAPGFNMVYADRSGNIGYQLIGHVPIRKTKGGMLPMPGWLD